MPQKVAYFFFDERYVRSEDLEGGFSEILIHGIADRLFIALQNFIERLKLIKAEIEGSGMPSFEEGALSCNHAADGSVLHVL